jgi:peptidoglycan/LPS O-acetylase OafA/YrhL
MVFAFHSGFMASGWAGVDLFFVISSFLFFHLLSAEVRVSGSVSKSRFYARRVLRIYPLMVAYTAAMFVAGFVIPAATQYDPGGAMTRLFGLWLGVDNLAAWVGGYNRALPLSPHLWTLSFELQIYLVIPFAFLTLRELGPSRFLGLLVAIWAWCLAGRAVFIALGAAFPVIYVTPFLRPESVLLGIVVAVAIQHPNFRPTCWVILVTTVAGALVLALPDPEVGRWSTLLLYPATSVFFAGALWLVLHHQNVGAILSTQPLRYLGKISYGLYVYHYLGLNVAIRVTSQLGIPSPYVSSAIGLAITIAIGALSYHVLERPFLRAKDRLSVAQSRPI